MTLQTLNTNEQKLIKDAIQEIDVAKTKIDNQREHIKDIIDNISETLDNKDIKKLLRKAGDAYHKGNLDELQTEFDSVQELYNLAMGTV